VAVGKAPLTMKTVLTGMIKAHEIQGCMRWKTCLTVLASITSCW
jgi:2-methylcitrate dehydratase PrpD